APADLPAQERCPSAEDRRLTRQARASRAEPQRPAPPGQSPAEAIGHATGTKAPRCLMTVRTAPGDTGPDLGCWVVGLRGLEPRTSSLPGYRCTPSGSAMGLVTCTASCAALMTHLDLPVFALGALGPM